MFASAISKLSSLNRIRTTAIRQTLGLFAALCVLILAAVPAMAQTITGSSATPTTYSGSGQTITFSFTVNTGNFVATSATVTSIIGVVYSCPITNPSSNTNVNFTCTGTYTTTATDVASLQVQERVDIRLLSFSTPTIMTSPILTATYVAPPPPTVTSISPTGGPAAGGTSVAINGTNFTGTSAVNFGATPATSFTVVSATRINAIAPAGTGMVGVRVTTGAGTSANSTVSQFTYVPAPTVTSITPASGPVSGGTAVVITGTNFNEVFAISFANFGTAQFTVDSPTQITLTTPMVAAAGTVPVRVTTAGGTSAINPAVTFTYGTDVAPAITTNPVSSATVNAGSSVSFTAAASGTPTPTVQWHVSTDNGATFNPISGATSATLTFTAVAGDNGKRYRSVFSNAAGSATTTAATLTVQTAPVITLQPVGATVAPGQPITLSTAATGNPTPTVQWSISENGGASWLPISTSLSFTIISPTARTILARAVFTNAAGTATTDAVTLTWVKQDQTISFTSTAPTSATVGGASYAIAATATSGLTVSFTIDPSATSVCSIAGGTVSFIGVGTCTINANQAGNTGFNAAPQVQQTFTVGQGANVITFPALSDTQFGSAPPTLSATASSGLAVSYASNSTGVCTVAGGTISFVAGGTCSITASQAGDANYVAATPVTQTFAVTQAPNAITFPPLADTPFTSAPPVLSATANSGLAVSYASNSTGVCTVAGGTISFVSAGTCSITASQAGNATYQAATPVTQTFAVTPGTNTITFPALSDTLFTSAPPVPVATASSGLAVSYTTTTSGVCTVSSGGTISFVSAGTCSITASQAGNGNYAAASSVTQSFTVLPGVNTITFAPLPNRALGSGSFALAGSASSGLTVTFTSATTGVCSVSGTTVSLLAVGTCTINANQSGNGSFQAAPQVSQSFQVTRAVTTVGLTSSASSVFFGMPVTLTATVAGTSPTGTVTFSDGATVLGSAPLAGNVATFTTSTLPAGARQLTATYNGDTSNLPASSSAVSVAVNARPNPANDPEVGGTVSTQFNTVERFGQAQINNISNRLDQLHSDGEDQDGMSITLSQPRARLASTLPWEQGGQRGQTGYGYNTGQPGSASGTMLGSTDPLGLGAVPVQSAAGYAATPGLVEPRVVHVWASGDISFGKQQPNGLVETRFTTSGITVGMDGRATDNLKLGVALGFAWDHSRFGTMGSESEASNASLAFYGSLKAAPKTFIDLIVGTGYGTIDSTRFSTTGGVLLDGKRRQRQIFAALIVTVEAKAGRLEIAPYLRADGIWVNLSPYTETGSPFWALTYQSASQNSYSGSAGVRLRYPLDKDGRWLLTGKAEYRQRVSGDYAQLLDYADIQGAQGSPYLVTGQGVSDSTFTGGIGLEARLRTMSLRLNYDLTTMAGGNVANSVSGGIVIKF